MSFHEKSAWACLLGICGVYVPYFYVVFRYPMAALGLIWLTAIGLVGILTVFHIANAICTKFICTTGTLPPVDELDQKIELTAAKWAGLVLAFAVFSWILVALYLLPALGSGSVDQVAAFGHDPVPSDVTVPLFDVMKAVHCLFAGFVFANIAYYAGIVFGYRRLARG